MVGGGGWWWVVRGDAGGAGRWWVVVGGAGVVRVVRVVQVGKGGEGVLCGLERGQEGVRVRRGWGVGGGVTSATERSRSTRRETCSPAARGKGARWGPTVRLDQPWPPMAIRSSRPAPPGPSQKTAWCVLVWVRACVRACVRGVCMFEYIVHVHAAWCAHVHGHLWMCTVHVGTTGAPAQRRYRRSGRRRWR